MTRTRPADDFDPEVFRILIEESRSIARRLVPNSESDQIESDVCTAAADEMRQGRWGRIENVRAWARTVATFKCFRIHAEQFRRWEIYERYSTMQPYGNSERLLTAALRDTFWRQVFESLSTNQAKVVYLLARQFTRREIAATLRMSLRTVDEHINRAMRKLQQLDLDFPDGDS